MVAKSETDLRQVKNQWKKIIDTIGLKEFPIFLRYFLIATRKQITKEYLFKEVKNFIKNGQDVFDLLDQLEFYAYNYVALGNPEDDLWSTEKENRSAISILKALRVTQWKPLAMVAAEKLNTTDFKRLLNAIIALSYRYNVIAKLQTNEMEKVYSKAAINLFKGYANSIDNILNDIKVLYVNDDDFKNYFALKQFNTGSNDKKLARYTLYKIEAQEIGGNSYDFENDNGTIEHILPESYSEIWQASFTEDEYERNVFLLGNLTLNMQLPRILMQLNGIRKVSETDRPIWQRLQRRFGKFSMNNPLAQVSYSPIQSKLVYREYRNFVTGVILHWRKFVAEPCAKQTRLRNLVSLQLA